MANIEQYIDIKESDPALAAGLREILEQADQIPELMEKAQQAYERHGTKVRLYGQLPLSSRAVGSAYIQTTNKIYLDLNDIQNLTYITTDGKEEPSSPLSLLGHELKHATQKNFPEVTLQGNLANIYADASASLNRDLQLAHKYFSRDVAAEKFDALVLQNGAIADAKLRALDHSAEKKEFLEEFELPAMETENDINRLLGKPERTADYSMNSPAAERIFEKRLNALVKLVDADVTLGNVGEKIKAGFMAGSFSLNPFPDSTKACPIPEATLDNINNHGMTLKEAGVDTDKDLSGCLLYAPDTTPGNKEYRDNVRGDRSN